MTRAGDRALSAPTAALAFMRAADDFARPAPLLFLLIEELEALPDLDPALPLLTFSLFDDLPEVPDSAPPSLAAPSSQPRTSAMPWSGDRRTWPGHPTFSRENPARHSWAPLAPDPASGQAAASSWQHDRQEGTPFPHSTAPDDETPPEFAFSWGDERRERHLPASVSSAFPDVAPATPERANGNGRANTFDHWTPQHHQRGAYDFAPSAPRLPRNRHDDVLGSAPTPSSPWPAPINTFPVASVPTPASGVDALALIDNLANDLLTQRPTAPLFINHPDTLPPRHPDTPIPSPPDTPSTHHPITLPPYHPTSDLRPPTSDSPPFEPDDIAEMVTDVLIEQARRHGVDLS